MVLAPDRVETQERIQLFQPHNESRVESEAKPSDPKEVVKFLEGITGRKIRHNDRVDYAGIQSGIVSLYGADVGIHFIN